MSEEALRPKVSVCVPTFQHVKYISTCLDSVLRQKTNFPFEIILGEDDSTDGTREICEDYAQRHPDIIRLFLRSKNDKVIINGKTTGRFNVINNLKAAKGEYIALLDGDDYWNDDNKLQKQVDFLDANKDYAVCVHRVYHLRKGKYFSIEHLRKLEEIKTFTHSQYAASDFMIFACSCMYRNYMYKELPVWFWEVPFIDYPLHLWNAQFGKVAYLPEPMAVYRIHNESMWALRPLEYRLQDNIALLHILIQNFDGEIKEQLLRQQLKLFKQLIPFLLKKEKTALQDLLAKTIVYPPNFHIDLCLDTVEKLNYQSQHPISYRLEVLNAFISKKTEKVRSKLTRSFRNKGAFQNKTPSSI